MAVRAIPTMTTSLIWQLLSLCKMENWNDGTLEYWGNTIRSPNPLFHHSNIDGFVRRLNSIECVIPAKAGIQLFQDVLDPGFRRGDDPRDFLREGQYFMISLSCEYRRKGKEESTF
jgi:hypothetical protein